MSTETGKFVPEGEREKSAQTRPEIFGWKHAFPDRPTPKFMEQIADIQDDSEYDQAVYGEIKKGLLQESLEGRITEQQLLAVLRDFQSEYEERRRFEMEYFEAYEGRRQKIKDENPDVVFFDEMYDKVYPEADIEGDPSKIYARHELDDTGFFDRKLLIEVLAEHGVGGEDTIEELIRITKHGESITLLKNEVADTLSQIDADKAGRKLLQELKVAKDTETREALAKVLYRIELGQIGISKDGIDYLGQRYDLGKHNDPGFFAKRLTGDGNIGLFDGQHHLARYFNLGDLSQEQAVVRAEVLEFTRDTLFAAKGNDAPEERARRQAVLNEFQKRYSEVYNDEFLADTGVHFNNLTFREQAWYLHFVESADEETRVRAKQFVAHYGEDGLRTFLSLEHGDEMGNKILTIGEKLPDRVARAVFVKYAEVVDASNRVSEYLQANYSNIHNFSPEAVSAVSERLLLRARDLLSGFAEDSDKQEVSGKTDLADANSVLEQLQRIKIEVILFADTFRAAQESGVIDFSDIENTELRVIDSGELSREEREEMMDIFVQNRRAYPSKLLEVSQAEFEQALNSGGKEFELLYHNDELVSFIRFDKLPSGNVYSGSFNVRPEAKGSAIGSAMIRATLDKKSESHNIEGEVYAGNPGALKFWERMGFRVSGEIENWKGTGERFIKVFRPKKVKSERLLEAA